MTKMPGHPSKIVSEEEIFEPIEGLSLNSDLGRAVVFARHHRNSVLYLKDREEWLCWDYNRWVKSFTSDLTQKAMQTALLIGQKANRTKNMKLAESAKKAQSRGAISSMLKLAASIEIIQAMQSDFDTNPLLLNVHNGVINLQTGSFRLHDPSDRLMRIAEVNFDPCATAPQWETFLKEFCDGDQDLMQYHQKIAGYCLTGLSNEQCMFLFYGEGGNGKSTLLQMYKKILGGYGQTLPIETIVAKNQKGATSGIARMQGVRMVVANELNHGVKLDEALIKQLTGSEDVTARFMFKEYTEFRPEAKIFLATNNLPDIQGHDDGIWRRIKVVPCTHVFIGDKRDLNFSAKLQSEMSGILNWCLEGCRMYLEEGLDEPETVIGASEIYRVNSGAKADPVGNFLGDCCLRTAKAKISLKVLYTAYETWCEVQGISAISCKRFSQQLEEGHHLNKDRSMSDGSTAIRGIQLRNSDNNEQGRTVMKLVSASPSPAA